MPPTPTPTPPPPTPPPTPPPPPPPPTPPPPPPTPPPPTTYGYTGTDCNGGSITIYTYQPSFSANDTAYSDSGAASPYSGYFIYNGSVYSYTVGTSTLVTSYSHSVSECAGGTITIYTAEGPAFDVSYTAYTNACLTTFFNGTIVIGGNNYKYSNGVASQSYAYVGTLCNGSPVTIYTSQSSFSTISTAFADECLTMTTYSGFFIYSGTVYYYQNGSGVQYSYAHVGTDCSINPVTIYTNSTTWSAADTAYSDQCRTTTYTGYFLYNSLVYSYSGGSASISSCATPPPPPTPPPPTPTPPPSPAPSYTNPNILKADIHSSYETGSGAWQTYRANVTGLFVSNSGANRADYRDHLVREFNRKISILNQPTGLFIRPFDDGFRFTGVSI